MNDPVHIPPSATLLRACLLCSLVKTSTQFHRSGCENCESVLHLKGDQDRIQDATTSHFDGLVAMTEPTKSWVGRWQRVDRFVKGVYAVKVFGKTSQDVIDELSARGVRYIPRDGSMVE